MIVSKLLNKLIMKNLSETTEFAQKLIARRSVTPYDDGAIKVLKKYVPDFSHIETGKNLDQKM